MSDQYCSEHDFYYNANHIIDVVCPWCEIDRLTAMLAESNAEIKLQKNPHRYNVMKQSIASQKRRIQELKDDIDLMKERLAASQQEVERLTMLLAEKNFDRTAGIEVVGHVCMQERGASVPGLSSALLAYPHNVRVLIMKLEG